MNQTYIYCISLVIYLNMQFFSLKKNIIIYTVSAIEKLTKRSEPEAHHERTSTVLRPYHERTSTVRPHHERTSTAPRAYLTAPERTSTAPRAYLNRTSVQYLDRTASVRVDHTVQELTIPCHERVRVTAYLDEPS